MKIYISKLKNSSVYKELLNNFFLLSIYILLFLLSFIYYLCIVFVIIYSYYLFKNSKIILKVSIILSILILSHFLYLKASYSYVYIDNISGVVIEVDYKNDYKSYLVKSGKDKYLIYDYSLNLSINYGDVIEVKGKSRPIDDVRIKGSFDYKKYLENKRIKSVIQANEIRITGKKFSIKILKHYFEEYLKKNFSRESFVFLKAMIIGDLNDIDDEFKDAIIDNGILHLFAVSGLHIVLFIGLLKKFLTIILIKEEKQNLICSLFLFIYLVITSFSASVLRASLMFYFSLINKKLKLCLSTLDIISLVFIFLLMINPFYLYDLGFNLSFISSTVIVIIGKLIEKYNRYYQVLIISIITNIITLPLVININGKINILSPISNVIFIELVEGVILPVSFFIMLAPILSNLYDLLIFSFNKFTLLFSKFFVIDFKIPYVSSNFAICYYLSLFLLIKVYKFKKLRYLLMFLLSIFLLLYSNVVYIIPKREIHFLDLYNGEASIIIDSLNDCYALIDTGDGRNNEVTNYLNRLGVKKLNYLILTHNHFDHNGEANNIIKNIKIENIVISNYDDSIIKGTINPSNINIIKVKKDDTIQCGKTKFYVLNPENSNLDTNDNSIVLYFTVGHLRFLFLGDSTSNIERKLLDYNIKVDVLKVAHHGSNTSTSDEFIKRIRPKYAIIMTGRVSYYDFPHKNTIKTLEKYNVIIYRTDKNYSIIYKSTKRRYYFETLK